MDSVESEQRKSVLTNSSSFEAEAVDMEQNLADELELLEFLNKAEESSGKGRYPMLNLVKETYDGRPSGRRRVR